MAKKCVYCNGDISDNRAMEICDRCGVGVWGQKMFLAIKNQTDDAKKNDDLCRTNMNFAEEFKGNKFKGV